MSENLDSGLTPNGRAITLHSGRQALVSPLPKPAFRLTKDERKGKEADALMDAILRFPGSTIKALVMLSGVPEQTCKRLFVADERIRALVEAGEVCIPSCQRDQTVMQRLINGTQPMPQKRGCTDPATYYPPLNVSKCPITPLKLGEDYVRQQCGGDERLALFLTAFLSYASTMVSTTKASDRAEAFSAAMDQIETVAVAISEETRDLRMRCQTIETGNAHLMAMMRHVADGNIDALKNAIAVMQPSSGTA